MSGSLIPTIRFTRRKLPHWEVEAGRYFVTVRCVGSLPREVRLRIGEIAETMKRQTPQSAEFANLKRRIFRTVEACLDSERTGILVGEAASVLAHELASFDDSGFGVPHFTILPTHWHAMIVSRHGGDCDLTWIMKRLKGRSAKAIRRAVGGSGPVWQREWFDHWVRNEAEWEKCVQYIRNNPVKAGIVDRWEKHPWTR